MNRNEGIADFVVRCVWLVFALVMWIIAFNMFKQSTNSDDYLMIGFMCLIPMALPTLRFIWRVVRGAGNIGAQTWDVGITASGHIYASNHRFLYSVIALVVVVAVCLAGGLFILPVYWIYFAICTAIVGFRVFGHR